MIGTKWHCREAWEEATYTFILLVEDVLKSYRWNEFLLVATSIHAVLCDSNLVRRLTLAATKWGEGRRLPTSEETSSVVTQLCIVYTIYSVIYTLIYIKLYMHS